MMQPAAGTVELAGAWEIVKSVLITLTAAGTVAMFRLALSIRDAVTLLTYEVRGVDGTNGIKSRVADIERRVDAIEQRNTQHDAIARHGPGGAP